MLVLKLFTSLIRMALDFRAFTTCPSLARGGGAINNILSNTIFLNNNPEQLQQIRRGATLIFFQDGRQLSGVEAGLAFSLTMGVIY